MTDLEKLVAGLADIPKDFPTVPDVCYDKEAKEQDGKKH